MDYSDSSEDEFSDIGSGSDIESEEEEVESEVKYHRLFYTSTCSTTKRSVGY